jgi:hypothetical protein
LQWDWLALLLSVQYATVIKRDYLILQNTLHFAQSLGHDVILDVLKCAVAAWSTRREAEDVLFVEDVGSARGYLFFGYNAFLFLAISFQNLQKPICFSTGHRIFFCQVHGMKSFAVKPVAHSAEVGFNGFRRTRLSKFEMYFFCRDGVEDFHFVIIGTSDRRRQVKVIYPYWEVDNSTKSRKAARHQTLYALK